MTILDDATKVIYGDREKTYGDPAINLRKIAEHWSIYLDLEIQLSPADVCNMMCLMKIARLQNAPGHRDSMVDICGYQALAERIASA